MKLYESAHRQSLRRWVVIGALALGVAACGGGSSGASASGGGGSVGVGAGAGNDVQTPAATTSTLTATLSGDQETTPTVTGALGNGTLTLSLPSRALSGGISINGMTATAAHIHLGDVGNNGSVIVDLTESAPGSGNWSVSAGTVLTDVQVTAFSAGRLYFNAHTTPNPGGEIRGQIGREVYAAQLSARQEVPTNASTATGMGFVSLDPTTKRVTARLTLNSIAATAAHIHIGTVGANGSVIVPMTETVAGSGIWVAATDTTMTDAQITAMKSGGLYFNAHSGAFPGGEIRGQIARNIGYASLNASQEVPIIASLTTSTVAAAGYGSAYAAPIVPVNASLATGIGTLAIDPLTRAVSGGITLTGMIATAAHIHAAAPGDNGPVLIALTDAGGGVWTVPANTIMTAAQLKIFKQGNLYFNAHSVAFPTGEIRGQIR